jgi:hypothetical protein
VHDSMFPWSASPLPTRYLRDFKRLESLYGGTSPRGLKNIHEIIQLGDSLFREDVVRFIESFRHSWGQDGLWDRAPLSNPLTGNSVVENVLRSLRCAETIGHEYAVDPFRLRVARILLYYYLEQKRIDIKGDPNLPNLLSQGKRISSVVVDIVLEDMYGHHGSQVSPRVKAQRRRSLKDHKRQGKRWTVLAAHLGIGIIGTCSRNLEIHM